MISWVTRAAFLLSQAITSSHSFHIFIKSYYQVFVSSILFQNKNCKPTLTLFTCVVDTYTFTVFKAVLKTRTIVWPKNLTHLVSASDREPTLQRKVQEGISSIMWGYLVKWFNLSLQVLAQVRLVHFWNISLGHTNGYAILERWCNICTYL